MIDEFLWKVVLKFRQYRGGQILFDFLDDSALWRLYNNIIYKHDVRHPNKEMISSRQYYSVNQHRVELIEDKLSDNESKKVFRQIVKYRQTHAIKDRPEYNKKNQYFPRDLVRISDNEVFIDCGAYNGDTIRSFLKHSNNKYKKIVAFEPDADNVKSITKLGSNIEVVCAAAWDEDTMLSFSDGKGSSSKIDNEGDSKVVAKRIDSMDSCKDATFIKMDIEGAEYNALIGAENTIKSNKPILAICIYHSDEDTLRIFELIDSFGLDYNYYIRHHAQKISETVLYAIPRYRDICHGNK